MANTAKASAYVAAMLFTAGYLFSKDEDDEILMVTSLLASLFWPAFWIAVLSVKAGDFLTKRKA